MPETNPDSRLATPATPPARKRDRHGRGRRGVMILPTLPGWRTRREQFNELVALIVRDFTARVPEVRSIEFAVQEAPPSGPAEWESADVILCRLFPRDRKRRLADRIVLYRRPILHRVKSHNLAAFLQFLLAQRISQVLLVTPEELLGRDRL